MEHTDFCLSSILSPCFFILSEVKGQGPIGVYTALRVGYYDADKDPEKLEKLMYVLAADGRQAAFRIGPVYANTHTGVKSKTLDYPADSVLSHFNGQALSPSFEMAAQVQAFAFCAGVPADDIAVARTIKVLGLDEKKHNPQEIFRVLKNYTEEEPVNAFLQERKKIHEVGQNSPVVVLDVDDISDAGDAASSEATYLQERLQELSGKALRDLEIFINLSNEVRAMVMKKNYEDLMADHDATEASENVLAPGQD